MFKKLALSALAVMATAGPTFANTLITSPQRFSGGNVDIQTQTGTSCSASAPDRASVGISAGYQESSGGGRRNNNDDGGLAAGVFLAMPFGGQPTGNCNLIIEMEQQRARLDMAVSLFEAGAMTQEELQEIANDVKRYLK